MKAYGLSRGHLSPYAARRVWRVLDTAAPSLGLPAETDVWMDDYPFSVEAETPLTVRLRRARRPNGDGGDVALFGQIISPPSEPRDLGNRSNQRDRRRSRRRRIRSPTSPRSTATTTRARRTT